MTKNILGKKAPLLKPQETKDTSLEIHKECTPHLNGDEQLHLTTTTTLNQSRWHLNKVIA